MRPVERLVAGQGVWFFGKFSGKFSGGKEPKIGGRAMLSPDLQCLSVRISCGFPRYSPTRSRYLAVAAP
jgi:hypothetical protein